MKEVFENMNMNKVAAIVVTYNRKQLLIQCLEKLKKQTASLDILIIDNNSTDGTCDLFESLEDDLYYFNTGSNLGGAGGFNYGMKKAYDMGYEYFWLMDDDTMPEENALEELLNADKELKTYGFLSSIAEWSDGSLCNMNIQRTSLMKKELDRHKKYNQVIMATFVSFFVKRSMIEEFGYPISDFIIWSDDLEYSRRISRKYPSYVVTLSRVIHKMKSNEKVGIESESEDRLWRYKLVYRNEVFVFRREGLKGWIYLISRMVFHSFKIILKCKDNKLKKIKLIWKSFFTGLYFNPVIEKVN